MPPCQYRMKSYQPSMRMSLRPSPSKSSILMAPEHHIAMIVADQCIEISIAVGVCHVKGYESPGLHRIEWVVSTCALNQRACRALPWPHCGIPVDFFSGDRRA